MALQIFHDCLQDKYSSILGIDLSNDPFSDSAAIWVQHEIDPTRAELLDRDLGVWFKFTVIDQAQNASEMINLEIQRALSDLSQLRHQTRFSEDVIDPSGGWVITLVFCVHETCDSIWRETIQTLRAQSGFSEELSIDVVFYKDNKSLRDQLFSGIGLSHFLLSTRQLFRLNIKELPSWLSADDEVRKMLEEFPTQFHDVSTHQLAKSLTDAILPIRTNQGAPNLPLSPLEIESLEISDVRNIDSLKLSFTSTDDCVGTHIIYGPNGTGKSSLFEALSLAVCGVSKGLEDYLDDADIRTRTGQSYISHVLKPFDNEAKDPRVVLNGESRLANVANDLQEAKQHRFQANGTLLSQEDARAFVLGDSKTLGTKILSGYSTLAQAAQIRAAQEYETVNRQRQTWLRQFNLNLNIKRSRTRWEKLSRYYLDHEISRGSQQIEAWLQTLSEMFPENRSRAASLRERWSVCDSEQSRSRLCDDLAAYGEIGADEGFEAALYNWLDARETLLHEIKQICLDAHNYVDDLKLRRDEIERDLLTLQKWLGQSDPAKSNANQALLDSSATTLQALNVKLNALQLHGQQHRLQYDHLLQLQSDFLRKWAASHPNHCPTCNADHTDVGGISTVVQEIISSLNKQILTERQQYSETYKAIKEIEAQRALNGECPLSDVRRAELAKLLGIEDEQFSSLDALLMLPRQVEVFMSKIDTLAAPPTLMLRSDLRNAAHQLKRRIYDENARGQALWTLPEQWDTVRKALDEQAIKIVQNHLPRTLEAVWAELAMVLTAAKWNLVSRPRMEAKTQRGSERLQIVVGHEMRQVLARHIYNQAEQHTLGLAWFFTRYLSLGRFQHALIAMDDPAQEMDQTTLRAFTRFLQILKRLHIRQQTPLSLVVLLHQEDRALDAARALDHQLISLKWSRRMNPKDAKTSVEHVTLLNPEFKAPLPPVLRKKTENVSV